MNSIYRKVESVQLQQMGTSYVAVPAFADGRDVDTVYSLNETAAALLAAMDGTRTMVEVSAELGRRYQGDPDLMVREWLACADSMAHLGLAEQIGESSAAQQAAQPSAAEWPRAFVPPQIDSMMVLDGGHAFYGSLMAGCCSSPQRCPS